jgi:ribonuclease BN (tRNA processing enzyme)
MCDVLARAVAELPESSRRSLFRAAGIVGLGAAMSSAGALGPRPAAAAPGTAGDSRCSRHRTRLVLLGTAGGPVAWGSGRSGVSTAVAYEDRVYVVDLGLGAFQRLGESGLVPAGITNSALSNVRAIFLTHMHSDHLADWPAVFVTAPANTAGRTFPAIKVYGPGDRGVLPRVFPPGRPAPPVVNPDSPTPGIAGMTHYLRQAFANDLNDRSRDNDTAGPDPLFDIHEIDLTGTWTITPEGVPPRLASPITVLEDDPVRVTATLVDHHPTAPAFAYRFDTPDGSVVISGDTTVSPNLIDLAHNADYLVHEVIDPAFVDKAVAAFPPETAAAVKAHLLSAHTTIEQVGRDVAQPAGVRHLVLNHLIPGDNPDSRWRSAQSGFSGHLTIGRDLMTFDVGTAMRTHR